MNYLRPVTPKLGPVIKKKSSYSAGLENELHPQICKAPRSMCPAMAR